MSKYKEAIEAIKSNYPPENYTMLRDGLDLAIEALEKQIPKKPAKHPTLKDTLNWLCPTCSRLYWKPNYNYLNDYCGSCGQKLDLD